MVSVRRDQVVHNSVVFVIHSAAFRVGLEPLNRAFDTLCESHCCGKIGDKAFYLAVVENSAPRFVAQQSASEVGVDFGDEIGGDIDWP